MRPTAVHSNRSRLDTQEWKCGWRCLNAVATRGRWLWGSFLLGDPVDAADDVSPDQRDGHSGDLDRCNLFVQDHDAKDQGHDRDQVSNDRGTDRPHPADQPDEQGPDDAGAHQAGGRQT